MIFTHCKEKYKQYQEVNLYQHLNNCHRNPHFVIKITPTVFKIKKSHTVSKCNYYVGWKYEISFIFGISYNK